MISILLLAIFVLGTAGIAAKLIYMWDTRRIIRDVIESTDPVEIVRLEAAQARRNQRW